MSIIGRTSGGMPIFNPFDKPASRKRTAGQRNKRYACPANACKAKTTKNQLKANGSRCHACKTQIQTETR